MWVVVARENREVDPREYVIKIEQERRSLFKGMQRGNAKIATARGPIAQCAIATILSKAGDRSWALLPAGGSNALRRQRSVTFFGGRQFVWDRMGNEGPRLRGASAYCPHDADSFFISP
jgi:hypothetical protein